MKGLIMAKKQKSKFNSKNVKINEEELSITKIGEMDTVNQSSTFVLILFGLIKAPSIYSIFNKSVVML